MRAVRRMSSCSYPSRAKVSSFEANFIATIRSVPPYAVNPGMWFWGHRNAVTPTRSLYHARARGSRYAYIRRRQTRMFGYANEICCTASDYPPAPNTFGAGGGGSCAQRAPQHAATTGARRARAALAARMRQRAAPAPACARARAVL